jgi:hypothetical protein
VRIGQTVGPAEPIFVLTDTEHIRAVFLTARRRSSTSSGPAGAAPRAATAPRSRSRPRPRPCRRRPSTGGSSGEPHHRPRLRPVPRDGQLRSAGAGRAPCCCPACSCACASRRITTRRRGRPQARRAPRGRPRLRPVHRVRWRHPARGNTRGLRGRRADRDRAARGGSAGAGDQVVAVGSRELEDGDQVLVEAVGDVRSLRAGTIPRARRTSRRIGVTPSPSSSAGPWPSPCSWWP